MSPIWGFGVENTVVAFFENIRSSYVYYFPVAVHFTPLQVVLESGVPAGLSFFIPYFLFAQKILTIRDKIAQIVVCSGLIFILTFFVFHPLDNWRRDFLIYGLFWGWSGCLLSDRKMIK